MLNMSESDTEIIKRSLKKPARVIKTELSNRIIEMEKNGASVEQLLPYIGGEAYMDLIKTGDLSRGVIAVGQTVGLIDEILPVKEVIEQIISDAKIQLQKLQQLAK